MAAFVDLSGLGIDLEGNVPPRFRDEGVLENGKIIASDYYQY